MSYENGIYMGEKHTFRDFGLWLKSKKNSIPSKIKIKETVPYMQGTYDFSYLYEDDIFEERELEYEFDIYAGKTEGTARISQFVNFIKSFRKTKLIDDDYPGYYFLVESEDAIESIEEKNLFTVKIKFKAYGLMIKNECEGYTEWDTFCFLTDTLQYVKFNINGKDNIILINNGIRSITPKIISSSDFTINYNGKNYSIKKGTTKDYRFSLKKGENKIDFISGVGTIEFLYRIEVL